jgi:hypothetical protein
VTDSPSRLRRLLRFLYGDRPWMALLLYSPTLLGVALDLVVRPRALARLSPGMMALYVGSAIAGSGVWGAVLWLASRLFLWRGPLARASLTVVFGGLFWPFACFAYGGQAIYYRAFAAYASRDSVRVGIKLRGTVAAWLASWGGGLAAMLVAGAIATVVVALLVRRAAAPVARAKPVVPVIGLAIAAYCYGTDFIETRALQAAPPDVCFMHGLVYAARTSLAGSKPFGVTLRTPDPLPELPPAARHPNVILILSESVRADVLCSERTPACTSRFLDEAAPDRVALGKLTAQASGTFSACMMLWTGMPPEVDFEAAHRAPMVWELARAMGYRTGYIASQNLVFWDLGTYLSRAGIDVRVGAAELGGAPDVHIGAPDEAATARALDFIRETEATRPYFAVVHLSNTHWPYRVDPALQPYEPHDTGWRDKDKFWNHYRNSVLQQERTVATFVRDLRSMPRWDDTVVLFVSDHGEAFLEHNRVHHLNTLFDEEVRVPGWILAGKDALTPEQRAAVETFRGYRTYDQDVNATVLDLVGVLDQRARLPFGDRMTGRSLVRPRPRAEPFVPMSTTSAVYEDDNPVFGLRLGEIMVVAQETGSFECFDGRVDPGQHRRITSGWCERLVEKAKEHFPEVAKAELR